MRHPIMRPRSQPTSCPVHRPRRVALVGVAAALLLSLTSTAAHAVDEPSTAAGAPGGGITVENLAVRSDGSPGSDPNGAPNGQNAWAIGPAGQDRAQAGNRPYFRYDVAPGGTVDDAVTLYNYSDNDLAFKIYPTDAFNTATGGYDLLQANQRPTDVGSWVQLENEGMLVPKHTSVTIPFKLTVPANASPGDHSGGVVASLVRGPADPASKEVVVEHRVGTRVYLRVTGAITNDLVVDKLDAVFRGGPIGRGDLEVSYTVRNAGNTRIRGAQQLDVGGPLGLFNQTVKPEDLPELLPGTTVVHTEVVHDVTPAFLVSARLTITPLAAPGATDALPPPVVRDVSVWTIPWVPLLWLVALVVGWRLARRVRRRARQAGSGGGAGRPSANAGPGGDGGGTTTTPDAEERDDVVDLDDLLADDPWESDDNESTVDA